MVYKEGMKVAKQAHTKAAGPLYAFQAVLASPAGHATTAQLLSFHHCSAERTEFGRGNERGRNYHMLMQTVTLAVETTT